MDAKWLLFSVEGEGSPEGGGSYASLHCTLASDKEVAKLKEILKNEGNVYIEFKVRE